MRKYLLSAAAALALVVPAIAQAGVVEGSVYLNNSASSNAVIGFSHGTADVTFTVPSPSNPACTGSFAGDTLCFQSGGLYTLGEFLSSGGATVLTGSGNLGDGLNNSVFEFTGTVSVTNGEQFQAGHDDGLQLMIGSDLVIDDPGPTSFSTTLATYTGPTGTFSFDLVYGECCGAPAALGIQLPLESNVPEPLTLSLFGAGLAGAAAMRRRRKNKSA